MHLIGNWIDFMDSMFEEKEKLYRAVLPRFIYDKKDGHISSAAFKDSKGLSVDRGYYRADSVVIGAMRKKLRGSIVSVTVGQCHEINAIVKYCPSQTNDYHSEIHGGKDRIVLSDSQSKHLADMVKMEFFDHETE